MEITRLATTDSDFAAKFLPYRREFLEILSHSYTSYYGDDYQLKRLVEGGATLYVALVDGRLVGASYLKPNLRRGGTAVYPENYRRQGIAEALARASLIDYPQQYTILSDTNEKILSLMHKLAFKGATSVEEIRGIVKDDFTHLSNFAWRGKNFVFTRNSTKRAETRENLTLLHTF